MNDGGDRGGWVRTVEIAPPSLADNVGDADRLAAALRRAFEVERVTMDLELLRQVPAQLRRGGYRARCACFGAGSSLELVGLAPPEGDRRLVGAAIDLGTTRVVVRLIDLEQGETLAEGGLDNPQLALGPDILTRIHHADTAEGLSELQRLVAEGIDAELTALGREAAVDPEQLCLIAAAGNTSMSHLLLGLEPRWIIREPYTPAANSFGLQRAADLGLTTAPEAKVFVFPNIGSYFGGDLIAGILWSGLHRLEEPAILVDVGTNAEVVVGCRDWLLACAGAAGPALEGGAATMGTMAGPGVIDRVTLEGGEIRIRTIDDQPPRGICGSGLIDLAAVLFRAGAIDIRGELVPEACGDRYVERDGVGCYLVVEAKRSATGRELTLSQPELDSLVRSKAAMFTILETITGAVGLTPNDLATFFVAGTFGAFIDPRSAITIGMLPDLPLETFRRLGNSSLGGATLLLTRREAAAEIAAIRDAITYLELNVNQDFMNRFSAAKFLPHTDPERFPSVEVPRQRA